MMDLYFKFLNFILINSIYLVFSSNLPEVSLEQGVVRGIYTKTFSNRKIASFEGIPYAKPPSGKHRFKEPVPADHWLGVYNATKAAPYCLQVDVVKKSAHGSEDCLYINVYTPQLAESQKASKLLDVIVFIHGGAFFAGKSGDHSPFLILDRDMVLVTFNYRLGPLGFLSTEDGVVPGNNGLKDQVLALKWIQKNIAAFSGNPKSVTIGGVSAGGVGCHLHLLSPLSKGLFKGAICMSGVALNPWAFAKNSNEKAKIIANELGCPTNESLLMINCLRDRPANHIVALTSQFLYPGFTFPLTFFAPVIEPPNINAFISDSPANIMRNKRGSDVPVIISYNLDEGLVGGTEFLSKPDKFDNLLNHWDELLPQILDYNSTMPTDKKIRISQEIKKFYRITNSSEGARNWIKIIGDRMFVTGISKTVKTSASVYSSPTYVYRFSYRGEHSISELLNTTENLGVCHDDDIFYTLGFSNLYNIRKEPDLQVSKKMLDIWESFAANGTPAAGNWMPVNNQLPRIVFTDIVSSTNFQLTIVNELGEERFWDCLLRFHENMLS